MRPICKTTKLILLLMALVAIGFALMAGSLGIDPDDRWGGSRLGLLGFGFSIIAILLIDYFVYVIDERLLARLSATQEKLIKPNQQLDMASRSTDILKPSLVRTIGATCAILIILSLYWVLASGTHLAKVPQSIPFYDLLADAFLHGQTSLLVQPPPALEQLSFPWVRSERVGIPVLGDASYYQGKYYLYWGPAPALFLSIWKLFSSSTVGDNTVTFFGVSLTFVFSFLGARWIRRRFFPHIPVWLSGGFVFFIATAHPMLWVLNPARIYEAAIACGQAFLLAGVYFALPVWEGSRREPWRYIIIGTLWSLAVASRFSLIGAIAVLVIATGLVGFSVANRMWQKREWIFRMAALGLPFVISISGLGLYNHARFGNALETGIRYQLSMNEVSLLRDDQRAMSLDFLPANTLYYIATPPRITGTFPFLRPFYGPVPGFSSVVRQIGTPDIHFVENATGIFFSTPILLLIIPLAWNLVCTSIMKQQTQDAQPVPERNKNQQDHARQLFGILLAASVAALIPFLSWYWVTTRFLLDAIPLLSLAVTIVASIMYTENYKYPVRGRVTTLLILFLIFAGIGISFLLALSGPDSLFDDLNPVLLAWINSLFMK